MIFFCSAIFLDHLIGNKTTYLIINALDALQSLFSFVLYRRVLSTSSTVLDLLTRSILEELTNAEESCSFLR